MCNLDLVAVLTIRPKRKDPNKRDAKKKKTRRRKKKRRKKGKPQRLYQQQPNYQRTVLIQHTAVVRTVRHKLKANTSKVVTLSKPTAVSHIMVVVRMVLLPVTDLNY